MALAFGDEIAEKKESLTALIAELKRLQKVVDAAIEERKRAENENKDLFRLSLSEIDLKEIKHLREVIPYLREARPLNKMIWEGYYQRTYKDLVIRLIGEKRKACGIYKLTNLLDGKVYIGQARDISERWSEHIKKRFGN
jgi:regulator of replication initiation timing